MWSLSKKKEYLKTEDKEILEQLFNYSPDLKMAYGFVLKLTHIFNSHLSKRSALRKINRWNEKPRSRAARYLNSKQLYLTLVENLITFIYALISHVIL